MSRTKRGRMETEILEPGNKRIQEACNAFLLNAWRHRRQEVAEIKKQIAILETQAKDLRVQIMSLWQLLESEKNRLATANYKAMQHHIFAEEAKQTNNALAVEIAAKTKELQELNRLIESLRMEFNNQKNELILAKQEKHALHAQLDKERVKVTKLREDKKVLLDKVHSAEAEANRCNSLLARSESKLKFKVDNCNAIQEELAGTTLVIKALRKEKEDTRCLLEQEAKRNTLLQERLSNLEQVLREKEEEIGRLKSTCNSYMVEAVQLKLASLSLDLGKEKTLYEKMLLERARQNDDVEKKQRWVMVAGRRFATNLLLLLLPILRVIAFP